MTLPALTASILGRFSYARNALLGRLMPVRIARRLALQFRTPRRQLSHKPRRPEELAVLLNARPLCLRFDGLELAGYEWRPRYGASDSAPILLMHGWEGRASQFAQLIETLLRQGHRVIAFDAPGHGDSPGGESTVGAFADLVLEIDHAHGPFQAAIGHSMGGAAVLAAATRGLRADKVVAISAPASLRRAATRGARALGLPDRALRPFLQFVAEANGRPLEALDFDRLLPPPDLAVLLLTDPHDGEVPASESAAVAGVWPNARLRHIAGVGHRRILATENTQRLVADFVGRAGASDLAVAS